MWLWIFEHEDGGSSFVQNIGTYPSTYSITQPKTIIVADYMPAKIMQSVCEHCHT
jgi:hypothetical protein